ncbi:hypothetical protein GVO57_02415 [Sphingomonas changnyeongensis]|uniref:BAAT/Acyl-CoA thioester hydrolase C-terminal domain-containing protein n=1 Tax=Sphingomonas changnyeongensis TaxID=2698679 RepID=A0A7Z2NU49_9SPHN|nr:acyl-CoA thioester hydrolase/BAAT C-terminal domain-containing protein [Sphingomonas changnyeongensis]QHL89885.1 hypothetical protein GVO57_02415 [Sphingomonas changnyeongensis]
MRSFAAGALALIMAGGAALPGAATAQGFAVPPVQMAEPGDAGRRIEADGLIGNWFPPAGPAVATPAARRPAILLLGGSEGALSASGVRMARALSALGYGVLQLSYFRAPGQSASLELVPLEMFDRALGWIGQQPGIDRRRLGVIGISKGGEAALLIASRNTRLRAVIAAVPSHVAWPGVVWDGAWGTPPKPSWSVGGQPVPVVPYGAFDGAGGIRSVYENGLKALADHPGRSSRWSARAPASCWCAARPTACGPAARWRGKRRRGRASGPKSAPMPMPGIWRSACRSIPNRQALASLPALAAPPRAIMPPAPTAGRARRHFWPRRSNEHRTGHRRSAGRGRDQPADRIRRADRGADPA